MTNLEKKCKVTYTCLIRQENFLSYLETEDDIFLKELQMLHHKYICDFIWGWKKG
jgi:hypothetical protein